MKSLTLFLLRLSFVLTGLLALATTADAQQLRIVHIDVGQGDATLIVGPQRTLLFDAGVTGAGPQIRSVLNSLGLTSIDFFVAGHYHEDHIGGIDELLNGGITLTTASLDRGGSNTTPAYNQYVSAVGSKRQTIALNQQIDLGGGCILTCLAVNGQTNQGMVTPTGENDRSVALVLRFGNFDYFIASDLTGGGTTGGNTTADVESLLIADVGDVDVLHCGHHGSRTSTNQAFVNALKPEHAIISCGDGNQHGHPTQQVLTRLNNATSVKTIWQTEAGAGATASKVVVGGNITFVTDGSTIQVTVSETGGSFNFTTDRSGSGGVTPSALTVVINEICWSGSVSSANDEWFELFNNSDEAVSLTNWRLIDDDSQTIFLSGTIPAKGFFLVERASSATSVGANLFRSMLSFHNGGDKLELKNGSGATVDLVNSSGGAWFGGSASGRKTMERKDPTKSGDDASNWSSNNGAVQNGTDSDGQAINGTPKRKNSVTP